MSALLPPEGGQILEEGRLIRPWRADDADAVYRACQDPVVQRWTNVPRPYLPEHAEAFVTAFTENSWETGSGAPFGVFDAATGELLGSTGLVTISPNRSQAEIGYWIAPWARRRGHAIAAARGVGRWALATLDLTRLNWRAEVGNHGSRLVAERIGVRVEGVLRQAITRPGGFPADAWTGCVLPGQLTEPGTPANAVSVRQATTFSAPQPRLSARTGDANPGLPVTLRAPDERDLGAITAACQDPEAANWTTVPTPYTGADARHFVLDHAPARWLRGGGAVFTIADAQDEFVGSIELRLTGPTTGDVGYLVAPWARGHGYATAALRAVCLWAFDAFILHRIEWRAYVGNEASRRVALRAGFTIEGTAREGSPHHGFHRDTWTGAILASDPG